MLLTWIHRTCNVLHASAETHLFQSIVPLPHNTHLYLSLIHSCLSPVKAMRTRSYRRFSGTGTEGDGGGLQWDFISGSWISYTKSVEIR